MADTDNNSEHYCKLGDMCALVELQDVVLPDNLFRTVDMVRGFTPAQLLGTFSQSDMTILKEGETWQASQMVRRCAIKGLSLRSFSVQHNPPHNLHALQKALSGSSGTTENPSGNESDSRGDVDGKITPGHPNKQIPYDLWPQKTSYVLRHSDTPVPQTVAEQLDFFNKYTTRLPSRLEKKGRNITSEYQLQVCYQLTPGQKLPDGFFLVHDGILGMGKNKKLNDGHWTLVNTNVLDTSDQMFMCSVGNGNSMQDYYLTEVSKENYWNAHCVMAMQMKAGAEPVEPEAGGHDEDTFRVAVLCYRYLVDEADVAEEKLGEKVLDVAQRVLNWLEDKGYKEVWTTVHVGKDDDTISDIVKVVHLLLTIVEEEEDLEVINRVRIVSLVEYNSASVKFSADSEEDKSSDRKQGL